MMKKEVNLCFRIALIIIVGFVLFPSSSTPQVAQEPTFEIVNIIEEVNVTLEVLDPMPVSEYIREYNMTKTGNVWRAINGSSYIDPNHEVVQWFERNTFLNESGLYYLNGKQIYPRYYSDFIYPNEDHWMNADYFLSHNLTGDCEDFAIGIASILEAKNIPNMIVCVSDRKWDLHAYLEYYYEGEYYIADTRYPNYRLREDNPYTEQPEVWMFDIDNDYMAFNENWMEMK